MFEELFDTFRTQNYLTYLEICDDFYKRLPSIDRAALKNTDYEDLIRFHHGLGTRIRNYYRLWDKENPITNSDGFDPTLHPDEISQRVIEETWRRLNAHLPK